MCVECLFLGTGPRPISFKFKFKYVCLVFNFKVTEPSPLQDSSGVRQKGGTPACAKRAYPDPPPLVPHPESLAAQAAYAEALLPGSAPARVV